MPASLNTWSDHLPLKLVNLATFLFFFGTNIYSGLSPNGYYAGKETYFTPASWTFGIWSLINFLLFTYVIYQFFDSSHDSIHAVGWSFAGIAILQSIFLHTFVTGHFLTAFIFSIFVSIAVSSVYYSLSQKYPARSSADSIFVHLPFSLWHSWALVIMILSGFAAFTHGLHAPETAHPGLTVKVLVVVAEAFLAITAVGYAFKSRKGDIAGAAVLAFTLFGIYDHQDNKLIHYFALGAFIVADIAIVKSLYFTFTSDQGRITLGEANERTPLTA